MKAYILMRGLEGHSNIEGLFSSHKKVKAYFDNMKAECLVEGWVCMERTVYAGTSMQITGIDFKCDKGSYQGFFYIKAVEIQ